MHIYIQRKGYEIEQKYEIKIPIPFIDISFFCIHTFDYIIKKNNRIIRKQQINKNMKYSTDSNIIIIFQRF